MEDIGALHQVIGDDFNVGHKELDRKAPKEPVSTIELHRKIQNLERTIVSQSSQIKTLNNKIYAFYE